MTGPFNQPNQPYQPPQWGGTNPYGMPQYPPPQPPRKTHHVRNWVVIPLCTLVGVFVLLGILGAIVSSPQQPTAASQQGGGTPPTLPQAQPAPAAPQPARNERGNIVKQLGEMASYGEADKAVAFTIDRVDLHPGCTMSSGAQMIAVHLRVATGSDAVTNRKAAEMLSGTIMSGYSLISSDGVTRDATTGFCFEQSSNSMPTQWGANQKYSANVMLQVSQASEPGSLMVSPSRGQAGWEWKY